MRNKALIIFGTGDIAQIANYYFKTDSDRQVHAFTVDSDYLESNTFEGKPVVPFEEVHKIYPPDSFDMFIALSYSKMNKIREGKYDQAKKLGYDLVYYVSSRSTYLSQFPCGNNCFILEDNTIQPYVKIGNNVTLWSGNHIGHHSVIGDHNFISSHVVISGHCEIKSNCFIGVNATIHNNVTMSQENVIGAGAIISKNTESKAVYLPAPSSKIARRSDELSF